MYHYRLRPLKVLSKAKQVRFTRLVSAAGKPHSATLWVAPEKDSEFKKAVKENRVVTIHNVNVGTKKDRGVIGFLQEPTSTYLVFPKSLPMAEGTGVIGLKFEELADAPVKDPVKVKEARQKSKTEKVRIAKEQPVTQKGSPAESAPVSKKAAPAGKTRRETAVYRVKVAFSATVLREIEVEATGAAAAIKAAELKANTKSPKNVEWKVEGLEVRKVP